MCVASYKSVAGFLKAPTVLVQHEKRVAYAWGVHENLEGLGSSGLRHPLGLRFKVYVGFKASGEYTV